MNKYANKVIPKSHITQIESLLTITTLLGYKSTFDVENEYGYCINNIAVVKIEKDNDYFHFYITYRDRKQFSEIELTTNYNTTDYTNLKSVIDQILYELKE